MDLLTLGIETSCDETAAAVLAGSQKIRSSIVASQFVHSHFGGVVPELASRAHIRLIVPIVEAALRSAGVSLKDIGLIAATYAPGLLGALLVGLPYAKALAWSLECPFVGVNHLEGHVFAVRLDYPDIALPFLVLIVSGGHTELAIVQDWCRYKVLGGTLDDACGEAFDKAAKMLGFPYPGGSFIEEHARQGRPNIRFPLPNVPGHDFSFSGLKTALLYYLRDHPDANRADVCCSFQEALLEALLVKTRAAATENGIRTVAVTGGVAVNRRLRQRFQDLAAEHSLEVCFPRPELCTDNAAVIAACGHERYRRFGPTSLDLAAQARVPLGAEQR